MPRSTRRGAAAWRANHSGGGFEVGRLARRSQFRRGFRTDPRAHDDDALRVDRIPEHPEALLQERAWLGALARQLVLRDQEADELAHEALAAAVLQAAPRSVGPRAWLAAILKKLIAG